MGSLTLEKPRSKWQTEYLAHIDESIQADGDYPWNDKVLAQSDFAAFLQDLQDEAAGVDLPPGIPPQQTYLIVMDDKTVIGELRFRPHVDDPWETYNGHIGANLRPAYRGKGHGTQMLKLTLELARSHGLAGVGMTIEATNHASIRVVEKCGGVLQRHFTEDHGTKIGCYWITL